MEYYIEGNPSKADQIRSFFVSKGYITCDLTFKGKKALYFTVKGHTTVHWCDANSTMADVLRASEECYRHLKFPKFKIGDVLQDTRYPDGSPTEILGIELGNQCYNIRDGEGTEFPVSFECIHKYYEYYNKKEVTLPFEIGELVLTRAHDKATWKVNVFSHLCDSSPYFACVNCTWSQCIPLKGNEHLAGTTQQCSKCYPSICYGKKNNA